MRRFALGSPSRTRIAVWVIRDQVDGSVYFGGDAMIWARELRGFLWIILALVIPCSWCSPLGAAPYSGGDGTAETPYLLSTAQDLATLANTQADWDKWFILTGDIDLKSTSLAKPIGSRPAPFTGVFDGGRHSIRNLTANDTAVSSTPFGLFGAIGLPAVIERLRLIDPAIQTAGNGSTGALVGEVIKGATIQQCSVEGGTVSTPASDAAGGLVGDNGGTVRECYSTTGVTALGLAGALLGRNTGLVENCGAAAAVTTLKVGTGTASGGLSGADVGGTIQFCLALSPSVTGARVAGLVGYASPTTTISNSVCNKVAAKAVENWPADVPGSAWCEDQSNLTSSAFFTNQGWDLRGVWFMDAGGLLRLRWASGGLTAVAKGPSGTVQPDPATGLARIALDGTESSDPDGSELRYSWKCLTASGEPTGITIEPVANPTVNLPAGSYRIELTVNNGRADSAPATLTFTVGTGTPTSKSVPTAVVKGPTGVVRPDPVTGLAQITLDGSQSTDPDKKTLKYNWKCLTSSGGATGITIPPVAIPSVSLRSGTYRIELTVSNGAAESAPAAVVLTIGNANQPPTAVIKTPPGVARPDAKTGLAQIVLDGSSSSDPDGDPLKYRWRCLTAGGGATTVVLDPVPTPSVRLSAGTYKIELTVNDGVTDSAPSAVSVTVNTPPIAKAGDSQNLFDDGSGTRLVKLDGSGSFDPEAGKGQTLVYSWTCATATPGTASGSTASMAFPVGTHTVVLTVSDGMDSAQDKIQITVMPPLSGARTAASPTTVGRTSTVADVKFYLLLPAGKSVSDVDTAAPMYLDLNGTRISLARDPTYSHKKYTVVTFTDLQKVLTAAGATNGTKAATVSLRLKTGESVSGALRLEVVAGFGPNLVTVLAERTGYYLDTKIWK
jgi:hypothetical protein